MKNQDLRSSRRTSLFAAAGILIVALALIAGAFAPAIQANGPSRFQIIDRDSIAYGRTYSDWSAAWEQWADSIPTASHPLFDNGPISTGQTGPVWFLGGKFCAISGPPCSYTGVVRYGDIPADTALYIAVLNSEVSTLEVPSFTQTNDLRAYNDSTINPATVSMLVDGQAIHDLKDKFRVQSPVFGFTLPKDNFFTAVGEGPFNAGTYFPAADDGVYVMLAPLSPGLHTIQIQGSISNFSVEVTYHLHVQH
ncbi:MAG TPA: hypothetical protein VLW54_01595 [Candidatus Acidoferrales bacterium]|nr:hypothetical protein [Candidatus Acidoferrales bacterium]